MVLIRFSNAFEWPSEVYLVKQGAAGTRIYAWAKVMGAADTTVTFVFSKGDRTSKQELKVPHSPYRTNAYKTFRAGDEGEWTVKLMGDQEAVLGSATFKVDIQ